MSALFLAALLAATDAPRPTVAVLYFDNNTGQADFDVLKKGLADMMITDLVSWDGVQVVEREKLEAVRSEISLAQGKAFDASTAARVGKLLGAQYLVRGELALSGATLRLDAKLMKVERAELVVAATAQGPKDEIYALEQELVGKLAGGIDAKLAKDSGRRRARVPDLDALVAYSKAVDLSDQGKLDEAQKAFQELVSKKPTFLMARERKEAMVKRLLEAQQRRKDSITESALAVGRMAEETLKKAMPSEEKEQRRYLAMRWLKGAFLVRSLKAHLSSRDQSFRVVLKGHEAAALAGMRAWLENTRRFQDEQRQWKANKGSGSDPGLDAETKRLVEDANFGAPEIDRDGADTVERFVLQGRARDGESNFTIAPPLGELDEKEQKGQLEVLEARVAKAAEQFKQPDGQRAAYEGTSQLELLAEWHLAHERVDDAIGAYQRILDQFPGSHRSTWVEGRIKEMLEGRSHDITTRERWAKALKGCDDMDIRVGSDVSHRSVARQGLAGVQTFIGDLEKACLGKPRTESAIAMVYSHMASVAATHEDCDTTRALMQKYLSLGGSFSDLQGYSKNYYPWCDLSALKPELLPSRVRVIAAGPQMGGPEAHALRQAIADVLKVEIPARGVSLEDDNVSRGDTRAILVHVEVAKDKTVTVGLTLMKHDDEPGAESEVESKGGVIAIEPLVEPVLEVLRRGETALKRQPHPTVSVDLLGRVAEAILLEERHKPDEARAAYEALLKSSPGFVPAQRRLERLEKGR